MAIKLLFDSKNKRHISDRVGEMCRQAYEDVSTIRERVVEAIQLTDEHVEPIRVIFIRNDPVPTFRVTILRKYNKSRSVKNKSGGTSLIPPGLYVDKQYICEKVNCQEFVFTPPLPEDQKNVA